MSTLERMNREQRRSAKVYLERESAKWPVTMTLWPRDMWPDAEATKTHTVWRSRDYLVQGFDAIFPAVCRLSINRTAITGSGWTQDIPWEELQRIKNECGYGAFDAVEVFPSQDSVVNVANMRHLWVLRPNYLPFKWGAA